MASKTARKALGRGLTKLIPQDSDERGSGNEVVEVDVGSIEVNPFQPRKDFGEEEIATLAESIRTQGLLQPILLRKRVSGYQIISGERRFRALQRLGRASVPAIVKAQVGDREMLEMALVENLQREDLNDIEKAQGYERMLLECGVSHDELSERVGVSRSVVTNTVRLLRLPQEVQQMVRTKAIAGGHARALAGLSDPAQQRSLARRIASESLSVRQVELLCRKGAGAKKSRRKHKGAEQALDDPNVRSLLEKIRYRLGTRVEISQDAGGRGMVRLAFFGKDDLRRVLELLDG